MSNKKWRPAKELGLPQNKKKNDDTQPRKQLSEHRICVTTVLTPLPRIRGGKVETLYEFDGLLLGLGNPTLMHCRIVRNNWAKRLRKATPGCILQVEGYIHRFGSRAEFHIIRGSISEEAHYVDGYKPSQRPDGSWRWFEQPSLAANP